MLLDLYAAFLETRRYASMHGATTEFEKEEGVTYDPDRNKVCTFLPEPNPEPNMCVPQYAEECVTVVLIHLK